MKNDLPPMNENSWIVEAWNAAGLKISAILSGVAGALVWIIYVRETSPRRAIVVLLMGAIVSGYVSMGITALAAIPEALSGAIGFIIGLTCMRGLELMFALFDSVRPQDRSTRDRIERIEENSDRIKQLENEWFRLMEENDKLRDENLRKKDDAT